ncbi:MAG: tRNA (adenosine(37)-N6)-threonylcarbamoyltransferase complex transferase subunit TsaD [bacterium]|nr:tRNA (adenosine(37)-N6)-threonylcarbamoyltransferase complex transferase subunit TsaD [bacterium]
MNILAIETSCDETSIALLKCNGGLKSPKFKILKNVVSSQIMVHREFGGVVPNLAKREHIKNLPKVLKKIGIPESRLKKMIDIIAVTVGPGLEPALWTGINFAEELGKKLNKPIIGANHMEGHLYSNWLPITKVKSSKIIFPAIALIVSGGHTILLNMKSINKWTKLGETLDDAAGEAFDKVARMLNLSYPGGPEIQKIAVKGNPNAIKFPRPMLNKPNYEFSFSGLKTSVLYYLRDNPKTKKADVAASFQQAVIDVLTKKTIRAAGEFKAKTILLCGGVSANKPLRESLKVQSQKLKVNFVVPDFEFNTDNASMIAAAAYINLLQKNKKRLQMEAQGNLSL